MTLVISTDVRCADVRGTRIGVGPTGTVEEGEPVAAVEGCETEGRIGSLVIVPGPRTEDGDVSILVVMGVLRAASACSAADRYQGCIVQRRRVRFVAHAALSLPVAMTRDCTDVPCDVETTCARGACVSATLSDPESCATVEGCTSPIPIADGGEDRADASDAAIDRAPPPMDTGPPPDAAPPATCPSGACQYPVETCNNCSSDCGVCMSACGDGVCRPQQGETCSSCEQDCKPCPEGGAPDGSFMGNFQFSWQSCSRVNKADGGLIACTGVTNSCIDGCSAMVARCASICGVPPADVVISQPTCNYLFLCNN